MSITEKYFGGVRPPQTYLAEDLDPEWLQQRQAQLEQQLVASDDPRPLLTQYKYACNNLELGINRRSHEQVDKGLEGFKDFIDATSHDITHGLVLRSRTFLIAGDAFHARTDRKKLFSSIMSDINLQTMSLLEEVRSTTYPNPAAQQRDMLSLISFGAISISQYGNNFPYFATSRESHGHPSTANHDWYSLTYHHSARHKALAYLRKGSGNPFAIHAPQQVADALMSRRDWYKDSGLPMYGPEVRQARLDAAADLLILASRRDEILSESDYLTVHALCSYFERALNQFKPGKPTASKSSLAAQATTESMPPRAARKPEPLANHTLAEQLRLKFGLSDA